MKDRPRACTHPQAICCHAAHGNGSWHDADASSQVQTRERGVLALHARGRGAQAVCMSTSMHIRAYLLSLQYFVLACTHTHAQSGLRALPAVKPAPAAQEMGFPGARREDKRGRQRPDAFACGRYLPPSHQALPPKTEGRRKSGRGPRGECASEPLVRVRRSPVSGP